MRVRVVAFEHEVLVLEGEQILGRRIEPQRRQRQGLARQLQPRLVEVVQIEVRVAEGVDELAGLEPVTWATIMVSSA